ncbi:hypothetical protein K8R43_04055 [archaeon]|nr:hypothetical protein [archaeon]
MKRGFSIFTPMVGTILITIALLIVASILQSERFAVAGTLQSYQSIKIANVMREAKSRIEEELRTSVFEKAMTSRVWINNCYEDGIVTDYYAGTKCERVMTDGALTELETKIADLLTKETMTSVTNRFETAYKSEDITLEFNPELETGGKYEGNLSKILVKPIEFPPELKGRARITLNFSKLVDKDTGERIAIATLKTETISMKIYLDPTVKVFESPDPINSYSKELGKAFQGFTLMNKDWHEVGDLTMAEYTGSYGKITAGVSAHGDGSKWYHYAYALQARQPKKNNDGRGPGYITTGWQKGTEWEEGHGFRYTNNIKEPIVIHDKISNLMSKIKSTAITPFIGDTSTPIDSTCQIDIMKKSEMTKLSKYLYQDQISGANPKKVEEYFVAGYLKHENDELYLMNSYYPTKKFIEDVYTKYTGNCDANSVADPNNYDIIPGGHITPTASPVDNWLPTGKPCADGTLGASNANDATFEDWALYLRNRDPTDGGAKDLTVVNTIEKYDDKYVPTGLKKTVDDITNHIKSTTEVKAAMGYGTADTVKYKINVTSYQFYAINTNITGGNNWQCGEFMAYYVPQFSFTGVTCASDLVNYIGGLTSEKDAFFLSLPLNYTCPTFTMVAVKEEMDLFRNNKTHPGEIIHPVYHVTFTRRKADYSKGPAENNVPTTELWEGSQLDKTDDAFADRFFQQTETLLTNDVNNNYRTNMTVRKCIYTYETGQPGAEIFGGSCTWLANNPESSEYIK